jgi:glycosyltransferase involved in cell wall biosynthesis
MQAWDLVRHSRESGNLGSLKDPHFRGDDVVLHIVGSGILENEVKEWSKTKHNVTVHGRLEGAELDQVYEQCQILIFPSICLENCPTVIVEALEKGLEVIASDTGGVGELVSEESLVEPGKIEDLRLKIEECLKQKH